jgi:hypothetical protein
MLPWLFCQNKLAFLLFIIHCTKNAVDFISFVTKSN